MNLVVDGLGLWIWFWKYCPIFTSPPIFYFWGQSTISNFYRRIFPSCYHIFPLVIMLASIPGLHSIPVLHSNPHPILELS